MMNGRRNFGFGLFCLFLIAGLLVLFIAFIYIQPAMAALGNL